MRKDAIKRFFTPDWRRLLVFVILVLVAFAGYTQSWVFSDKDAGVPKSPFFDLLAPFPFWLSWVMLLFPLGMLSNLVVAIGGYKADLIMRGPFWLFWVIQLLYFYVISCVIASVWMGLIKRARKRNNDFSRSVLQAH